MAKEYKNSLKQLGDRLKSEPAKIPIQEVRPVEEPKASANPKKDAHINFWVPDELMERLKIQGAKSKMKIKEMGIEAFEEYLTKREK